MAERRKPGVIQFLLIPTLGILQLGMPWFSFGNKDACFVQLIYEISEEEKSDSLVKKEQSEV